METKETRETSDLFIIYEKRYKILLKWLSVLYSLRAITVLGHSALYNLCNICERTAKFNNYHKGK